MTKHPYRKPSPVETPLYQYKCSQCDLWFYFASYRTEHRTQKHDRTIKTCQIIGCTSKTFNNNEAFKSHIRKAHDGETTGTLKTIACKDEECSVTFTSLFSMNDHVKKQHKDLMKCEYCEKMLSACKMDQHVGAHTRLFKCEWEGCDWRFSRKNSLDEHVERFHEGMTYACLQCGKSYSSTTSLARHDCNGQFLQTQAPMFRSKLEEEIAGKRKAPSSSPDTDDDNFLLVDISYEEERGTVKDWTEPYLINGYDDRLLQAITARNQRFTAHHREFNPGIQFEAIGYGTARLDPDTGLYIARKVGMCDGLDGDTCPYTDKPMDESNTYVQVFRKGSGSNLTRRFRLAGRCYLCQHVFKHRRYETTAFRELAGKCVGKRDCKEPIILGDRMCKTHRTAAHANRLRKKVDRSIRLLPSSDEVADLLQANAARPGLSPIWHVVKVTIGSNGRIRIYVIDTEWLMLAGNRKLLIQLGFVDLLTGERVLDVTIDYGMSLEDLVQTLDMPDKLTHSAFHHSVMCGLRRFYGPQATAATTMMPFAEIASKLSAMKLQNAIVIEHSTNYCDYEAICNTFGKACMPPKTQALSTLPLLRDHAVPGMASYSLPAIYPAFQPDPDLIYEHHIAIIDAEKLGHVMDVVLENAKCFEKSDEIVGA